MQAPIDGFWAKLLSGGAGSVQPLAWHPLADHCGDVAACAEALFRIPTINARLARFGGRQNLDEATVQRLAFLACLHDVGKFNHGFQNKAISGARPVAGHVAEAASLLCSYYDLPERAALLAALGVEELLTWVEDEGDLVRYLVAVFSHHGRPVEPQTAAGSLWRANHVRDPIAGVKELTASAKAWLPAAFERGGTPLPSAPGFQHAFAGLVMLADWIASDTKFFPFAEPEDKDRIGFARARAREAIRDIGLDAEDARTWLREFAPTFTAVLGVPELRPIQTAATSLPTTAAGSLAVLEAETGSGKTEAALAHFLTLFRAGYVDGLYFALPTRTAATQLYRRVVRAMKRAFPETKSRPPTVLAVPGYLEVDGAGGRRLAPFEVLWADDDQERFRFRGWAAEHPKRYLAGTVVVGTVDQVLLSTLAVGHAHMRASALLRHLLVVDEVHCSDPYMTRLLGAVLKRQLAAGGHSLLMSATLGSAARERLLRPETHPRGVVVPGFNVACDTPYPAFSHRSSGSLPTLEPVERGTADKLVTVTLATELAATRAVAERALRAAAVGAAVVVLRNTVRDCLFTQQALEGLAASANKEQLLFRCENIVAPHHARFAKDDRAALDDALEKELGKDRPERGVIAVTTQTVQQSLDLDADLLITDLCPVDVLLQRIGRLHRHPGRPRPRGFEAAHVVLLVPEKRDLSAYIHRDGEARGPHGLGTVYADLRVLEATWRVLLEKSTVAIPTDNRWLVESATHPHRLASLVGELGGPWLNHASWIEGVTIGDEQQAQLNLMHWESPFLGDDEMDRSWLFPSREMARRIATRLGQNDRLAVFDAPLPGPFGRPVRALTLPAYWTLGAAADERPVVAAADAGVARFRFGDREFVYDRLGLRPHTAESEDDHADA